MNRSTHPESPSVALPDLGSPSGSGTEFAIYNGMEKTHKFESRGLGKAPFRVVGCERRVGPIRQDVAPGVTVEIGAPGQPMGCCDYCGTGIADCYVILSSDGKRFIVGSDCVMKTGDAGLKKNVDEHKREIGREKRHAKSVADRARIAELQAQYGEVWKTQPHPRAQYSSYFASQTYADYVDWMVKCCGMSGIGRTRKAIEAHVAKGQQ